RRLPSRDSRGTAGATSPAAAAYSPVNAAVADNPPVPDAAHSWRTSRPSARELSEALSVDLCVDRGCQEPAVAKHLTDLRKRSARAIQPRRDRMSQSVRRYGGDTGTGGDRPNGARDAA